jgi:hypothetical protein
MSGARAYEAAIISVGRDRLAVPVPFDPNTAFGIKPRHHITGTLNGGKFRGVVTAQKDGWAIPLASYWRDECHVAAGDRVKVVIAPEGPQRRALAPDIAAALAAKPAAAAFFDGLAQFYRKAYLVWIDGTKRRPDERARRIAEFVGLLKAGVKTRPK